MVYITGTGAVVGFALFGPRMTDAAERSCAPPKLWWLELGWHRGGKQRGHTGIISGLLPHGPCIYMHVAQSPYPYESIENILIIATPQRLPRICNVKVTGRLL